MHCRWGAQPIQLGWVTGAAQRMHVTRSHSRARRLRRRFENRTRNVRPLFQIFKYRSAVQRTFSEDFVPVWFFFVCTLFCTG